MSKEEEVLEDENEDEKTHFWDSSDQRKKASKYAKYNDYNIKNYKDSLVIRALFRSREGRDSQTGRYTLTKLLELEKKYVSGRLTRPINRIKLDKYEMEHYRDDQKRLKKYLGEEKVIKEKRITSKKPLPLAKDYEGKPEPTGFISDLPLDEWLLKYVPQLFGAITKINQLTELEIEEITAQLKEKDYSNDAITEVFKINRRCNYGRKITFYKSQLKILEIIQLESWVIIKIFRSAGKTQLTAGLLSYFISQNPDGKFFFCCEELRKAQARVNMVRSLLVSPLIVQDYGYLINDNTKKDQKVKGKDIQGEFVCHRNVISIEPTLQAITPETKKSLGQHYNGGFVDDPWSMLKEAQKGAKEKWLHWWREFMGSLEKCDFLFIICTRKGVNDIYATLSEEGEFADITQPLIEHVDWEKCELIKNKKGLYIGAKWELNEDGSLPYKLYDDCKGKYSMTVEFKPTHKQRELGMSKITCLPIKHFQDPLSFEMEYQQNPYLPEGDVFKWKYIHVYDNESEDPFIRHYLRATSGKKYIKIMDMAIGESSKADDNCLMVLCKFQNRYFIEKIYVGKWNLNRRKEIIKQANKDYPGVPIYIEDDFWQLTIIKDLKASLSKSLNIRRFKSKGKGQNYQGFYKNMAEIDKSYDTRKVAKMGKIHDAIKEPWDSGNIFLNRKGFYVKDKRKVKDYFLKFQREAIQFPKCKWWEGLDTLAMGILVFKLKKGGVLGF